MKLVPILILVVMLVIFYFVNLTKKDKLGFGTPLDSSGTANLGLGVCWDNRVTTMNCNTKPRSQIGGCCANEAQKLSKISYACDADCQAFLACCKSNQFH